MATILNHSGASGRWDQRAYESEVERLCGYLKNDSLIRWHLGCSQDEIDAARKALAKRQPIGTTRGRSLPACQQTKETAEEEQRRKAAAKANRLYLAALGKA